MKNTKYSSSVLLSIFKRKGEEGSFTKIIGNENRSNYEGQLVLLEKDEHPLLCFKEDDLNWLLLTDQRVLEKKLGIQLSIPFDELSDVNLAMQEEFKDRIVNKEEFTRLVLKDKKGNRHIIKIEKGRPFQGIFQVLHHLASKNKFA